MPMRRRTLRSRIVAMFAGFAMIVALTFGFFATIFVYTVEDQFFETQLAEEAAWLERDRATSGAWSAPRSRWMSVHTSPHTMPADLRAKVASAPLQHEFRGEAGRHYHLRILTDGVEITAPRAWLVAEVSSRLVVRPMRYDLLREWLAAMLVVLLLAVGLGLWLSRRIAQPLATLAEHVRQLHPSQTSPPLRIADADREVEMVSGALNEMNDRVHAFVEREQLFTRGASHELRTPLSVITSTTAQVLDDDTLSPTSRRLLTLAHQSAAQMERNITSLLELTREDAVARPATPVLVMPVIESVVLDAASALDARGLTVQVEVPGRATLSVAPDVLHLVLSSMLGNAVTHAAHGPIGIRFADGALTVSNPIDPASLPSVAALGVPGVKRADSPGSGLGLALLQRLCSRGGVHLAWHVSAGEFNVVVSGRALLPSVASPSDT